MLTLVFYAGWQVNDWLRYFVFNDELRTVFSFAHYDVSLVSSLLQEGRSLVIAFLIAYVCDQRIIYLHEILKKNVHWEDDYTIGGFLERTDYVARLFNFWQGSMLFISLGFIPWTLFYWSTYSVAQRENRYIVAGIITHVVWIMLWVLISAPLAYVYYRWVDLKSNLMAFLVKKESEDTSNLDWDDRDRVSAFIKETNPLTTFQYIGAGIASLVSFFLPLINFLFE